MPVGADPHRVQFRLLFQEGERAARSHQHDKPIAVSRRLDRIERVFVRRERPGEMVRVVALRRMRGVELAPVGLWPAPDFLAEAHLVAAPIDRNARVPAFGVSHHAVE